MQGRGRGRGRAGTGLPLASPKVDPAIQARLKQLEAEIGAAGVSLNSFLQLWVERFGSTLPAADHSEVSVQAIIQKHSQGKLLVVSKRQPGQHIPEQYVLPRPSKQQLENAVRKVQEQLHSQGLSVTLGSLDCALAQAFGLTGSLSDFGYQPRDLAPMQDVMTVERNVSVLIATFLRARQVCTLADLDAYLAQQHKVASYNDLCMGPLLAHELVLANFRPPSHVVEIPQVRMIDVIDVIADLMEERPRHARQEQRQEQSRLSWPAVRQRLETKFSAPFEDLCVRLPDGDRGLGIYITNMVSGWKSEREQYLTQIRARSLDKKMMAGKCGAELHEVAQNLVLGHARSLQGQVQDKIQALQAAANRAVEVFYKDESIAIHTKLVMQPLPLIKLQALLRQLLLSDSSSTLGFSSSAPAAATQRRIVKVRKAKGSMYDSKAVSKSERLHTEMTDLARSVLFKAAGSPFYLLTVDPPANSSALLDMDSLLTGSRLQTVKALFNGDVDQAAKAVHVMLSQPMAKQLMAVGDTGVGAVTPAAGAEDAVQQSALAPDSTGTRTLQAGASASSHAAAASGAAAAPGEDPLHESSRTAIRGAAELEAVVDASGEEALPAQSQLSPEQLSELLWELLDVWHDVLQQQQEQHYCEQQLRKDQQELQEALLQIGIDPQDAQEEARKTAEKRAQQRVVIGVAEKLGRKHERRWWRQQELPAVFGSSSEDADLQLECVSAAAGKLVEKVAGSIIKDKRLTEALVRYWQHDALLQLLLHAVRVLMQHAALLQTGQAQQQQQQDAQQPPEEKAGDEHAGVQDAADAAAVKRSVGLPELLLAVQELGKGASLHALWQLEVELLKRFGVPSFQALKLPAGCTSLLSAVAAQDELAAALTGYDDAWDCGAVPYGDVLRVVQQALGNMQHSTRGKSRTTAEGSIRKAVSAALCMHFKVPDVLRLGYGPVQGLIQAAKEDAGMAGASAAAAGSDAEPADAGAAAGDAGAAAESSVVHWPALALTSSGALHFTAHASGLTPHHALGTLAAAPVLAELCAWSDWDTLYAPRLGHLAAFVSKYQHDLGFRVLEVPGGGLLKLPRDPAGGKLDLQQLRAGWKLALEQDRPEELVGLLLLHITQQGGLAAAHDLVMLGDLLGSLLAADVSRHQGGTGSSGSRSWMQTAVTGPSICAEAAMRQLQSLSAVEQKALLFVLQCLQLLPVPVAPAVAGEVLLRPLAHVLAWEPEVVHWALLVAAAAAEAPRVWTAAAATGAMLRGLSAKGRLVGARQRLHALGFTQLGVAAWQDDCLAGLARPVEPPLQVQAQAQAVQPARPAAMAAADAAGQQQHSADAEVHAATAGVPYSSTEPGTINSHVVVPADHAAATAAVALPDDSSSTVDAESATASTTVDTQELPMEGSTITAVTAARGAMQAEALVLSGDQPVLLDLGAISDPCQRLIEERRRLRGVGMHLQGEAAAFARAQIRTIGNAIKKLSSELYTKDVHFIMELVQNADDNSYTAAAGLPVLELVTSSSAVTCLNNEAGFTPDDVEGICEVGGSKKQGKAGFTGQKGIGFKAVFRVTSCPQIHSRGFHFAFDLDEHPEMGYVLPTWVGDKQLQPTLLGSLQSSAVARLLQQQQLALSNTSGTGIATLAAAADAADLPAGAALSRLLGPSSMTLLHLPLKPGSEDVGQKLAQLRPTLLLFLRQLRCLVLSDAEAGTSKVMLRIEEPNSDFVRLLVRTVALPQTPAALSAGPANLGGQSMDQQDSAGTAADSTQQSQEQQQQRQVAPSPALSPAAVESLLSQSSGCEVLLQEESRWLVVSDTFSPGDICRLGYEVEATTVSLAFGIHECQPSQKEVFAFLPVRRYGLNFIVQGDFVVPSSRGDVDLDDPFNQLLHSKVPALFASSFTKFKAMVPPEGQQQLYWMNWWLKCVPLPDQMHEFFASLPEEVASHLQALPCIPTEADDGGVGPWVPPGNALVCSSPHIKELVSAEQLARLQGKFFVHPSLTALHEPQSQLRRLLRIREFDPSSVITLVRDMAAAGELSGHSIPQLRQLLVTVFGLLFGVGLTAADSSCAATDDSSTGQQFSMKNSASSGSGSSIRVQSLLKELKECPLLPLYGRQGVLVPARAAEGASTVFFPVDGLAASAGQAAGAASRGTRASRPQRPTSAADSTQSASQLAKAALKSCSITQQQLAGLDSAVPNAAGGAGALLFVDPELLQLEDQQQLHIMVQGLKGLGVRELEPLDVMHGYILPQLADAAERCKQHAVVSVPSSAATPGAGSQGNALQTDKAQQLHLMRLLAFPLAARLLDIDLGTPVQSQQQQQQQLAGHVEGRNEWVAGSAENSSGSAGKQSSRTGTLLSLLAHVAVLVTSAGHLVLARSSSGGSAAGASSAGADEQCLFLPKQLGNSLDLPKLFPAHPWTLISPDYATCCVGISAVQWQTLMQVLGVQAFLPIRQQTVELTWKQLMVQQQYATWKDAIDRMDDSVRYVFTDVHWRDLQRLLDSIAGDTDAVRRTEQYRSLSRVVATQWEALKASGHLHCSYNIRTVAVQGSGASAAAGGKGTKGKGQSDECTNDGPAQQRRLKKAADSSEPSDSSKLKSLSAAAASWQPGWQKLPSSVLQGLQTWEWMLASDGKPHAPTELFARQQEIQQLFKKHVLYIVVEDISHDMALTLGATCNTSPETVLQVLSAWSAASAAAPKQQQSTAIAMGGTDTTPAAAAAAAAASAAAATDGTDNGGFTSTLHDMTQLYHHLSRFLVQCELPSQGFSILQDQGRLAALPRNAAVRVQASKAFIETPLIWLPDTDEFLKAAAAHRAAESQRGYMDEDSYSMGGSSFGGRQPSGLNSNSKQGGRGGRAAFKPAGRVVGAAQKQVGEQQGGAAASDETADDVMYDGTLMGALSRTAMRGRFYSPDQLRFTDDAKIFEITFPVLHQQYGSSSNAAGMRPPPMLRVLGAYYGALRVLFVELLQRFKYDKWIPLVGEYPTFGDYLRTLDGFITATGNRAQPGTAAYRVGWRVLSAWSSGFARKAISPIAQQHLINELLGGRAGKPWKVLPGRDGSWLSLGDHPHIPDDSELFGLFEDVEGITFLAQPGASEAANSAGTAPHDRASRSQAPAGGSYLADFSDLWYALQVPYLSQVAEPGPAFIQPSDPQLDRPLSVCLAAALPLLQRHLFSTLPRHEYKVLDEALGPRLAGLKVYAVAELARVYQLRVLNSSMAADGQAVSRDGASWVQRKQPCVALLDLAPEDQEKGQLQQQGQSTGGQASAATVIEAGSAAGGSAQPDAAVPAQAGSVEGPRSEPGADSQQQEAPAEAAADDDDGRSGGGRADALFVVCPEKLIECCHQVSAEVSAYIGLLAEEAGCSALDVGGLTALLEKLLMVQATGGDVSQVMRQPPYSRYQDLPKTTQPWQLHVPSEPEPEPEPESLSGPSSPRDPAAGSGAGSDGVEEEGAGQGRRPGQLAAGALGLDLSDLLSAAPTEGSGALDALHQWRLEHDAEVRAKMEAAAEKRAAQAAAEGASGAAASAAGSTTAAAGGAPAPLLDHRNPLVISSNLMPAVIPALRRLDAAAAGAAASAPQQPVAPAPGAVAAAAASDYHQEVVVVLPQASPAAPPAPVLPPSLTSPDKIVVLPASQQATPAAAAAAATAAAVAAVDGQPGSPAAGAAAGVGVRRHLDMNAAAASSAAEGAGAAAAVAAAEAAGQASSADTAVLVNSGVTITPLTASEAAATTITDGAGAVAAYSLFPAATAQDGSTAEPGQFSLSISASRSAVPLDAAAGPVSGAAVADALSVGNELPAPAVGARMPQLVFMGLPTFSLLGPATVALSLRAAPGTAAGASMQQQQQYGGQGPLRPPGLAATAAWYTGAAAGFSGQPADAAAGIDGFGFGASGVQQQQQVQLQLQQGLHPAMAGQGGPQYPVQGEAGAASSGAGHAASGLKPVQFSMQPAYPQAQLGADFLGSMAAGQAHTAGVGMPLPPQPYLGGAVYSGNDVPGGYPARADAGGLAQQRHVGMEAAGGGGGGGGGSGGGGLAALLQQHRQQDQQHHQAPPAVDGGTAFRGAPSGLPPPAAAGFGLMSPLGVPPSGVMSWHEAEGAARAAGLISQEVPLPQQVLTGLQLLLPPAPQQTLEVAAVLADVAAVGRFGEELAYLYYLQHPDMQQAQQQLDDLGMPGRQLVVDWVNRQQESWLPFDLTVSDAASGAVLCFVEVKSSRDGARQFFDMTQREMDFAAQHADRYHILRIRGVGSTSPTLERLINPVKLWRQQAVRVCVVL